MASRMTLLCPIAGAFHRPPAKTVIENLPAGTSVILSPEPENPYDGFAIKVLVDLAKLDNNDTIVAMQSALDACGADSVECFTQPIQLGYLAATEGKPLARTAEAWISYGMIAYGNQKAVEALLDSSHLATLAFGPDGHPAVRLTYAPQESDI